VLYYIKVTKFVKLANFNILEDFRVPYIKVKNFVKFAIFVFIKIFMCYTT